jgi:hypothetical protein
MTQPDMTQVGADLYAAVEPLTSADESLGWPLALYLSANGLMLDEIAALVRTDADGNEGWTAFADPARCPDSYLYTLAVWAGVPYPRRMSKSDLRAVIGPHAPGVWRGTKAAIEAAIRRFVKPGAPVYFEERADGDPYAIRIFTYSDSTLDQGAIQQELLNSIPAGLILTYEVRIGQTYGMLRERMATYQDMKDTYPTYADVRAEAPLDE